MTMILGYPATLQLVLPHMGQRRSAKINEILRMDLSHRPKGAQ